MLGSLGGSLAKAADLPEGLGSTLGDAVGHLFRAATGYGDYSITPGSAIAEAMDPPTVSNVAGGKGVVIKHREYIQDIISSPTAGAFNLQSFLLNPGVAATFPWLSSLAANFEHYRWEGLLFEYRPMSGNALNSVNTALGQVIMACNYNAAAPNFGSKFEMENYEFGISNNPAQAAMAPIEMDRQQSVFTDLYVRPGAVPAGQDPRLYDFGNFQIATNGLQGTAVNCGELWVTYQVRLFKPKVVGGLLGDTTLTGHINQGVATNSLPLGSNASQVSIKGNLPLTIDYVNQRIMFPPQLFVGTYYLMFSWHGGGTTVSSPAITAVNGTLLNNFFNYGSGSSNNSGDTNCTTFIWNACIQITAAGAYVQFGGSGTLPTSCIFDGIVTQTVNGAF